MCSRFTSNVCSVIWCKQAWVILYAIYNSLIIRNIFIPHIRNTFTCWDLGLFCFGVVFLHWDSYPGTSLQYKGFPRGETLFWHSFRIVNTTWCFTAVSQNGLPIASPWPSYPKGRFKFVRLELLQCSALESSSLCRSLSRVYTRPSIDHRADRSSCQRISDSHLSGRMQRACPQCCSRQDDHYSRLIIEDGVKRHWHGVTFQGNSDCLACPSGVGVTGFTKNIQLNSCLIRVYFQSAPSWRHMTLSAWTTAFNKNVRTDHVLFFCHSTVGDHQRSVFNQSIALFSQHGLMSN